jgi:putative membrane-bound dehydrogenase-like protein
MHRPQPAGRYSDCRARLVAAAGLWASLVAMAAAADPRVLLDGAVLERFAAEPDIVTPVGAAFDPRGRLVVVESHTHFRPEGYAGPRHDRLRIVEDTDGDGRADRFRTFLDGLTFAMGVRRGPDDWLYVVTRGGIERVRDGDGDDVAEIREQLVRLETAGTYPHNGLGGLAFDAAGRLWFGLGENLGADYRLVAADGSACSGGGEGGSVFRCTAAGGRLERMATGFWNPFGLCCDPAGRTFAVDNDPDSRPPCRLIDVAATGDYGYQFRFGRGGRHPLQAWDGELPGTLPMAAGTGEAPCTVVPCAGGLWVTSWGGNRVERFTLEPRGASVKAAGTVAIQGDHRFRPVDAAVAPDGSLFITDWVDRSYPVHGAGRIWRLRLPRAPAAADTAWLPLSADERRSREVAATPAAAPLPPATLAAGDPFLRQAAVAALVARGGTALPALDSLPEPLARQAVVLACRWLADAGDAAAAAAAEAVARRAVADADDRVRIPALRWIAGARMERLRADVERVAADRAASPTALQAALAALAWLDGTADVADGRRLAAIWQDAARPDAVRATALALLAPGSPLATPAALAELVRDGGPALAREAARTLAMRWGSGAAALADLAADPRLPAERRADATAGLAKAPVDNRDLLTRLAGDPERAVAREARRGLASAAAPTGERPAAADLDAWLERLGDGGSADAGWRTFFAVTGGRCSGCHLLGGRGGAVGPELTGIAARMGRRRVLESILQPNKEVGPGYQAYAVELTDGRVVTGIPAGLAEGGRAEKFLTSDGGTAVVPVADIEARTPLAASIMPHGLEQGLTDDDLRDLLAVLAEGDRAAAAP